jgi:hypothetical protein
MVGWDVFTIPMPPTVVIIRAKSGQMSEDVKKYKLPSVPI